MNCIRREQARQPAIYSKQIFLLLVDGLLYITSLFGIVESNITFKDVTNG
jgi:hypothetical protein